MKNVRKLFALLGLVGAFAFAQAQSSPQAEKILKASQKKFDNAKDLSAAFTYTLSNPNMKKPIVKQGRVLLKGEKYKVNFTDEVMVSNGRYLWLVLVGDEEVTKTDFTEEGMSPSKVFSVYKEDTKSRYDGVDQGMEKLTLFAESKTNEIWKTELWINKSDNMPGKAKMYARNGSTYEYTMQGIKMNTSVPDSEFEVDESGYEDDGFIITDLTE